mmetsp:Transcript_14620/g.24950  ORF Transcript_14620/g.24950 Transcript_14620/m.24950 type:complete len:303 (+) Transcript_14620:580-1488(+)
MMGVSPTRPDILLVRPPVEVAAARLPLRSRATHPTVPMGESSQPLALSTAAGMPLSPPMRLSSTLTEVPRPLSTPTAILLSPPDTLSAVTIAVPAALSTPTAAQSPPANVCAVLVPASTHCGADATSGSWPGGGRLVPEALSTPKHIAASLPAERSAVVTTESIAFSTPLWAGGCDVRVALSTPCSAATSAPAILWAVRMGDAAPVALSMKRSGLGRVAVDLSDESAATRVPLSTVSSIGAVWVPRSSRCTSPRSFAITSSMSFSVTTSVGSAISCSDNLSSPFEAAASVGADTLGPTPCSC